MACIRFFNEKTRSALPNERTKRLINIKQSNDTLNKVNDDAARRRANVPRLKMNFKGHTYSHKI